MDVNTEKYELAKKLYLEGNSLTKIQKMIGIERHRLSYLLQKDNIKVIQNGAKYDYIEDAFDTIDTQEKAYWLGFLYADGNIIPYGKYEVKISLAYKDLEHVKKFGDFILKDNNGEQLVRHYTAKIKGKEYPSAKVCVTNKKIVTDLISLGCTENKSLTLKFPSENQVPSGLIRHFVRGYFDGDGCIGTPRYGYQNKSCDGQLRKNGRTVSFVGTYDFLQSLLDIFANTVCTDFGAIGLYQKQNQQAWQFSKTKYSANQEIYEYLYKDATIYLERKREKFASLYGNL